MKRKIIKILGFVLIILLCFYLSYITIGNPVYEKDNSIKQSILGEIMDGTVITQEFTTDQKEISGVKLRFATYGHILTGNIEFSLSYADNGEVLSNRVIDTSKLKDNAMYSIIFEKSIPIEKNQMRVTLKGSGTKPDSSATVYAFDKKTDNTTMTMNHGIVEDKTLNMSLLFDTFSYTRWIYLSVVMSLLYCYILFVLKSVISKK